MTGNIGVVVGNLNNRGMSPGRGGHLDIQVRHALGKRHIAVAGIHQKLAHASAVLIVNALEHFERTFCIAAHGAQHRGRLNAMHAARIGHGHALHVLDNVARTGNVHMLGFATERLTRECRRIGNGNGLGAAERADKFAVQNITKRGIAGGIDGHKHLLYT